MITHGDQNDDRNSSGTQILLMRQVLIRRDQDTKSLTFHQGDELAILLTRPTQLRNGSDIKIRQFSLKRAGDALVKQKPPWQ